MSSPLPCEGDVSLNHFIPYFIFPNDSNQIPNPISGDKDNVLRFWIHMGLVCFGFLIAVISILVQCWKPLPYGKLSDGGGFCNLPVRPSWVAVHIIPGFFIFTVTYFTGHHFNSPMNIAMYLLFTLHYLTRGVFPLVSRYSHNKIPVWVTTSILLTNAYFHYVNAEFVGSVDYCRGYYYDPRFILGAIMFVIGFIINRASDVELLFLRKSRNDCDYLIPKGFLFYLITCPNYFGEGLQWLGWAMLTWSLAGLVWWLFLGALFLPRSRQAHSWYRNNFKSYPSHRKALLPFIC